MSDLKMAAKLKSRLNEWQGYIEQASTARQQAPEVKEAPVPPRSEEDPIVVPATALSAEPLPAVCVNDSLMERYESQIADLRAALEHERAQARRLAETLAREQTLNAYPRPTQPSSPSGREYRAPDYRQAGLRRSRDGYVLSEKDPRSVVLWLIVVLTVSGLCSLVAFAVLH